MALDNKFRVSELAQSGSRAIISEDPISKTHTFIDGSTTIVSKSAIEPYEHIEGERDGELTNFIEKPKYEEEQLKKAVDTVIDELIVPPLPPSPPVVPKPVYDDLLERYNQAIADLADANNTIRDLQAQVAQLQGQIQSLLSQLDAAQVARTIAENQLQQQASSFGELAAKFSQAIIKGTKEATARVSLQAQVEGLTAQKDTLREQILQLRQIIASLQGQVEAQLGILDAQIQSAENAQAAADQALIDTQNAAEEALNNQQSQQAAQITLNGKTNSYGKGQTSGWKIGLQKDFKETNEQVYIRTYNDDDIHNWQGQYINVYNFSDTEQNVTLTANSGYTSWLVLPGGSLKLPPRSGTNPGKGHFQIQAKPRGGGDSRRNAYTGELKLNFSGGDSFVLTTKYWKEVGRSDSWSPRGSATKQVGSERV